MLQAELTPLEARLSAPGIWNDPEVAQTLLRRRKRLESAGASLGQVLEDLFNARVPVKRIFDVAALDFVVSLELSQTREPLHR